MRKIKFVLLTMVMALCTCIGIINLPKTVASAAVEPIAITNNTLVTADGFNYEGGAQIRTTNALTGNYTVSYNVNTDIGANGWIGIQYLGLGGAKYIQMNLLANEACGIYLFDNGTPSGLTVYNAVDDSVIGNPRSYELGGAWFGLGTDYSLAYEVSGNRINFLWGDGKTCKAYVLLPENTAIEGVAAFCPHWGSRANYKMTIKSVTVNGNVLNTDKSTMIDGELAGVKYNSDVTLYANEGFENVSKVEDVTFKTGSTFAKYLTNDVAISTAGLNDDEVALKASFEVSLATSNNRFLYNLEYGFAFGMPAKDSALTENGVVSVATKMPMAGMDLRVGNGTELVVNENVIGNAGIIYSAHDSAITTLTVSLVGTKNGNLAVTYDTNLASDEPVTVNYTGMSFDGYCALFVIGNGVTFDGSEVDVTVSILDYEIPEGVIVNPESITLSKGEIDMFVGEEVELEATVLPEYASDKSVTWTTSDGNVATVENGKVKAVGEGSATITATTANGLTATATVTVQYERNEIVLNSTLQTTEEFIWNGEAQISSVNALSGEYTVEYNTKGTLVDWIAIQYLGYGDETYLQINLFVSSNITVTKVGGENAGNLVIYDATTDEPMTSTRSLELGGNWFNGPDYIFKYEITEQRLNFWFGYANSEVISRAYVLLGEGVYGEYTDGKAVLCPNCSGSEDYSFTVNSISLNGKTASLDMAGMEGTANNKANADISISKAESFANTYSTTVEVVDGEISENKWVSAEALKTDGYPNDADVFNTTFEVNLYTDGSRYIPSGLIAGFVFGMPTKESKVTDNGVVSLVTKLPMAGMDLRVGNGTEAIVNATTVGDASQIFSVNEGGISTLYITINGKKDGTLKVSYRTNHSASTVTEYTYEGINFDGYISFFVDANVANLSVTGNTLAKLSFNNVSLPSMKKIDAESITLNESSVAIKVGETAQLSATVKPNSTTIKTVTWTSSDVSVATVDANGLITAIKEGSAVITATTENGLTATCNVLVPVEVTGVTIDKESVEIGVGRSTVVTAIVNPDNATDKSVTWSSSDENIATVDADGKIVGVSAGQTTITVTTANGKTATVTVNVVIPVTSVTLSETEKTVEVGEEFTLIATVNPEDAGNKQVTWSSSDETVATVDETGKVVAIGEGTATISVLTRDGYFEATCKVTVGAATVEVSGITLDKQNASVEVGQTVTLTATVNPSDATDKTVTWTTSDESVATVDVNGVVTTIKEGSVVITATAGGFEATCEIAVTAKTTENDSQSSESTGEKGGCMGSIGSSLLSVLALSAFALLRKKK